MKLSARKKGQIYDLVHSMIVDVRVDLRMNELKDLPLCNKIDYKIAQVEIPLAQKLMRLLDKNYDK